MIKTKRLIDNIKLVKEWDYDKNIGVDINKVALHSGKKYFWKCLKGHSWEATVDKRANGNNCPYCSNQKVLKRYNDLATTNPEILDKWDYKRNSIKPTEITYGSNKKYFWICEKGHSYKKKPKEIIKGSFCPICNRKKILNGYNDLATTHPYILKEWDNKNNIIKPNEILYGTNKLVWWKCEKDHSYKMKPIDKIKGKGCPYCAGKKVLKGYNDLETLRPDLLGEWNYEKNNDLKIYPNKITIGSEKKVWWKCKKCGYEWNSAIYNRAYGFGCKICGKIKAGKNRIKTMIKRQGSFAEQYPKLLNEWDYAKNSISPYEITFTTSKKVWWKCEKCGHEWETEVRSRVKGYGCPKCSNVYHRTDSEFKNEIKKISPNIVILSNFKNTKDKLLCKCLKCGNIWQITGESLLTGHGCNKCARLKNAKKQMFTKKEFAKKIQKINRNITIQGKYNGIKKSIKTKCNICGNIWNPKAESLLNGIGCPNCSHTGTSYVEKFIYHSFVFAIGKENVISRDRKIIGKELDIFIPKYNLAIEPGGWHWHYNKIEKDLEKIELSKKKKIKLLVIYDVIKENVKFNNKNILTFKEDLSNPKNYELLKSLVSKLLLQIKFKKKISDEQWENIKNLAYISSRKINTKEFINQLKCVNKDIKVIGEYKNNRNRIKVECKKCHNIWFSSPNHLLRGQGCPICRGGIKYTNELFVQKLKLVNKNLIPLEKYTNSKTKIKVKCKKCANIWESTPSMLLKGYGCNKCEKS